MSNILKKLYHERAVLTEANASDDPEYQKALQVFKETNDELLAKLDKDAKGVFEEYIGARTEMAEIRSYEDFAEGFRLGSRFTYEILANL